MTDYIEEELSKMQLLMHTWLTTMPANKYTSELSIDIACLTTEAALLRSLLTVCPQTDPDQEEELVDVVDHEGKFLEIVNRFQQVKTTVDRIQMPTKTLHRTASDDSEQAKCEVEQEVPVIANGADDRGDDDGGAAPSKRAKLSAWGSDESVVSWPSRSSRTDGDQPRD